MITARSIRGAPRPAAAPREHGCAAAPRPSKAVDLVADDKAAGTMFRMATHQADGGNANVPERTMVALSAAGTYPPGARLVISPDGQITADVPCAQCRYNLVTLASTTRCPECAQPVSDSLRAYLSRLCFASPSWVTGLRDGLIMIVGGLVLVVVGALVLQAIVAALIVPTTTGTGVPSPRVLRVFAWISAAVGTVLYVPLIAGVWALTAAEPGSKSPQTARRTARVCLWLLIGCYALSLVAFGVASWNAGTSDAAGSPEAALLEFYRQAGGSVLMAVLGFAQMGIFAIGALALLEHLRTLLARIPRPRLAGFARVLTVGGGVVLALLLVVTLVQLIMLDWVFAGIPTAAGPGAATWVNTPTGPTRVITVTGPPIPPATITSIAGTPPAGEDEASTPPSPEPAVTTADSETDAALEAPGTDDDAPADEELSDADTIAATTSTASGTAIPPLPIFTTRFFAFAILAGATGCLFLAYGAAGFVFACLAIPAFSAAVREARQVEAALQVAEAAAGGPAVDKPATAPL